jgi:hypothetical protein
MTYILEIYYQGDCIDQKHQNEVGIAPLKGEQIHIDFNNPSYSEEHGNWWIVKKRKHLLFAVPGGAQTLQLFCEPDPKKGA